MGKLSALMVVFLVVGMVAGCVYPAQIASGVVASGRAATVEEDYAGFDRVEVGSAFVADIKQSDKYSVVVTVDENLKQYLDVSVQGDTLRVRFKPASNINIGGVRPRVVITMPAIKGLELNGASRGTVGGFESDADFDLEISGASSLEGQMATGDIRMRLSGASTATLEGQGGNLDLEASGASRANLGGFPVADAKVEVSGASRATINASGRLDGEASGASRLSYKGNPTLGSLNSSGASTIAPE